MRTHKLLLLLAGILLSLTALSQTQSVIAKFVVTDARKNHLDYTKAYIANGAYFVFYITADKKVFFGSIMKNSNQQSYGEVSELIRSSTEQTSTEYATNTFNFKWSYNNTYDNAQGTAKVNLVKIDKPGGIAFEVKIIPENLDLLEYKGYMEGSLKLN
jgi:hypothetical protein